MKTNLFLSALRFGGLSALIAFPGLLVGAMVVILPPMAAIGVVGIIAAVLIWVTPELNQVSVGTLRKVFFVFLLIQVCIPGYYAVQISGLPWISPRRVVSFLLIVMFLLMVGTSHGARQSILTTLVRSKALSFCIVGFFVISFLSIFSSVSPIDSISHFSDALLNWYIPMFACIIVVQSAEDVVKIYKFIAFLSIFVASVGIVEFASQHRVALDLIPEDLLEQLMDNNPSFVYLVNLNPIREGIWRASSIYNVPLSFGEFAVMVAPVGAYFILHGSKGTDRVLGIVVLIVTMVSLYISGSRGGSAGFVIAMPIFAALWVIRYVRSRPRSLVGPISTVAVLVGAASLIAAISLIGRLHNIVIGGGATAASNEARFEQWSLGIPHILHNPVTGNGFGMGGEVVGFAAPGGQPTIDSYVLTVIVETGVPGLVLFFGGIVVAIFYCVRIYLRDPENKDSAIAAALACSMIAFGFYRIALSQRENHTLFFIFLGLISKLIDYASTRADGRTAANSDRRRKGL